MGFMKDFVGDFLGYGRCPVTGDTYLNCYKVSVPYSPRSGLVVSRRALSEVPRDRIAEIVLQVSGEWTPNTEKRYSLGRIFSEIPHGCAPARI